MNSNQSKNLTQKQQELVKRLENIRKNKKSVESQDTGDSTARNRNAQQNRPVATNSRQTVNQERTRTASQKKFARPAMEAPAKTKAKPIAAYKPRYTRTTKSKQQPKRESNKKNENYINQLSNGKRLSQAIILSEILDKPVALRKR